MSIKPPTEQENQERPLLPYENAKVRRVLRLGVEKLEAMANAYDRSLWMRNWFKWAAGAFLLFLTIFALLREQLIAMFGGGGS